MIEDVPIIEQAAAIAAVDSLLYSIEDALKDVHGRLAAHVETGTAEIASALVPTMEKLYSFVDVNLPGDDQAGPLDWSAVQRLSQHVSDGIYSQEHVVATVADRAVNSLNDAIANVVPGPSEIFSRVIELFSHLIDGLLGTLTTDADFWQTALSNVVSAFVENPDQLAAYITHALDSITAAANERMPHDPVLKQLLDRTPGNAEVDTTSTIEDYIAILMSQPQIITHIVNVIASIHGVFGWLSARDSAFLSGVRQAAFYANPTTPLSAGDLIDLLRKEYIGEDFAKEHAKRTGVSNHLFDLLYSGTERMLTVEQVLEWWRRTGEEKVLHELGRMGYTAESIERLRGLALATPTASDVVRFLARDVYDPTAIAEGQLDQDFQKKYDKKAFDAAGVSEDTAKLYWMAHWSLPSPSQGYSMVHRGLIDIPQLQELLKLADYAPGWVQHLIDIAYVTPGRIDVRRMYETGIITTDEELESYYKMMGYSPEHAIVLRNFAKRLKAIADEGAADRRFGRLANEIVRSFVVGSLSAVSAQDSLIQLGFTPERAELRIAEGEYGRQRARADAIRDAIGKRFIRGYSTDEETVGLLGGYGFDEEESSFLLDEWHILRELREETAAERHQKDLSKSEIIAAYADGLFTHDDASSSLVSLGYDGSEAGVLLSLEDAKAARADAKATEASARTQYLKRRIEASDARGILEGIGYTPIRVAALLSRWEVEREESRPDISAGQLERMLMQGVIPLDQIQERLRQAGYTEQDISALLTLYGTDVSVAEEKVKAQQDQFAIREKRLTEQGNRRLDLTQRSQDIGTDKFTASQQGLQQRFEEGIQSRADLQTERLKQTSTLQTERIAAQTERDAAALAAARDRQATAIQASIDKLNTQISAAAKRAADANAARQAALDQRERLAAQSRDASDARTAASLAAQASRQQQSIDAANRRADAAAQLRQGLQNQHEQFTAELTQTKEEATRLRDIATEASRARQLGRTEQVQIRKEQRQQARKDITSSDAAALESQLQSVQLQKSAAVADVESRFAALQAQISDTRQTAALARRQAAEQALAAATPATSLLDSVI